MGKPYGNHFFIGMLVREKKLIRTGTVCFDDRKRAHSERIGAGMGTKKNKLIRMILRFIMRGSIGNIHNINIQLTIRLL